MERTVPLFDSLRSGVITTGTLRGTFVLSCTIPALHYQLLPDDLVTIFVCAGDFTIPKPWMRLLPREDAMKLNLRDFIDRSEHENCVRQKKDQDAEQIDTSIKAALEEFGDYEPRRAAFMALLAHVRSSP